MATEIKIFMAKDKDNGDIVNASSVQRGNDCNCICIGCGEPLQARQGNRNRHHFSHINNTNCSPETVLHIIAKQVFMNNNKLLLPEDKGWFHYTKVKEECLVGNQKPDIIVKGPEGTLHIEIAVTHFIDDTKLAKITLARYNTVEIDLSHLEYQTDINELQKILIERNEEKYIVYWKGYTSKIHKNNREDDWKITLIVAAAIAGTIWLFVRIRKMLKRKR